jgi:hypothetical protein
MSGNEEKKVTIVVPKEDPKKPKTDEVESPLRLQHLLIAASSSSTSMCAASSHL